MRNWTQEKGGGAMARIAAVLVLGLLHTACSGQSQEEIAELNRQFEANRRRLEAEEQERQAFTQRLRDEEERRRRATLEENMRTMEQETHRPQLTPAQREAFEQQQREEAARAAAEAAEEARASRRDGCIDECIFVTRRCLAGTYPLSPARTRCERANDACQARCRQHFR